MKCVKGKGEEQNRGGAGEGQPPSRIFLVHAPYRALDQCRWPPGRVPGYCVGSPCYAVERIFVSTMAILTYGRVMPFYCFALCDLPMRKLRRYALSADLRVYVLLTCTHGLTFRLHGYTCILCVGTAAGVQNHAGADWETSDTACRHSLKPSLLLS